MNDSVNKSGGLKEGHDLSPKEGENILGMIKRELEELTGPSFDTAYKEARNKRVGPLALKLGSVSMGAIVAADGVYNMIAGFDEEVDDTFIPGLSGRNYVRMFVGAGEVLGGAALLHVGLTAGPRSVSKG